MCTQAGPVPAGAQGAGPGQLTLPSCGCVPRTGTWGCLSHGSRDRTHADTGSRSGGQHCQPPQCSWAARSPELQNPTAVTPGTHGDCHRGEPRSGQEAPSCCCRRHVTALSSQPRRSRPAPSAPLCPGPLSASSPTSTGTGRIIPVPHGTPEAVPASAQPRLHPGGPHLPRPCRSRRFSPSEKTVRALSPCRAVRDASPEDPPGPHRPTPLRTAARPSSDGEPGQAPPRYPVIRPAPAPTPNRPGDTSSRRRAAPARPPRSPAVPAGGAAAHGDGGDRVRRRRGTGPPAGPPRPVVTSPLYCQWRLGAPTAPPRQASDSQSAWSLHGASRRADRGLPPRLFPDDTSSRRRASLGRGGAGGGGGPTAGNSRAGNPAEFRAAP